MKIREFSLATLGTEAAHGGSIVGGMIAAKAVQKMVGQDTLIVNAGIAATGLAGAVFVDHPLVNAVCHGIFIYGALKTLTTVAKDVAPVGVNGLGFTAPEGIRAFINDYVPSLGNAEPEYLPAYSAPGSSNMQLLAGGNADFAALASVA